VSKLGRSVESYHIAVEDEIGRWSGFTAALRRQEKEAFAPLMNACRVYASAASNASNPIIFEPMIMSILLWQQINIEKLQKEVADLKQINAAAKR
jgi:hypothetical protein